MGEQHSREWMETVLGALVKAVILRLGQEGHVVIENRDGGLWVRLCEQPYGEATSLSNAAPDLLAACQAMLSAWDDLTTGCTQRRIQAIEQMRGAVARAGAGGDG